ncbi:hypothetical protein CMQ_7888 [Grosmannia clavigera kw1407]|uniref:DUF7707 domain-containing protein n=1 Tax=Grosmannia clavigera (strain kw1407 / UAMH 11150) TaxID=655863 RepID=F0XS49_GROCL|nr:uncharacterized protein CMQ_7888 [Grosmannia clavigera kw1407]EFW99520.1 hypothetical protein CMQ_7888 [Grosmannia clavigera kw1407]
MPSLKLSLLAVTATLLSAVRADYYVEPSSVPLATRKSWCASETSTCPLICEQTAPYTTKDNTCDPSTLTYGCVCGNGLQPNISEYSLSLPYFVCSEWGNQCVTACGSNNTCSSSCRQDHPCGALNPSPGNASLTTTSAGATSATSTVNSATIVYGAFGTTSTGKSSSSSKGSFAAPLFDSGRVLGLAATLGGLTAGIALFL